MSIVLRSRKTLAQRYRGVLKKYGTLSHLWDFGVVQGPLAYAATHTAAEFIAAYPLWPLWQDTAGTVPACKINDQVGLCLDQGGGSVTLGPELVVNGDNETGVVTSLTTANGSLVRDTTKYKTGTASAKFTANSATSVKHQFIVATIQSNKSIIVEYDYFVPTGSITSCRAFDNNDGSWFTNTANGSVKDQWVHVQEFRAAKASVWDLAIGNNVNQSIDGQSFWLDNISVREVIGAHASQATTTKRPILSGRVNLLTATTVLSTQSITTLAASYKLTFVGSGTVTLSGTYVGSLVGGGSLTFTATAGALTLTVTGSVTLADLRHANSPQNIPAYQRVTSASDYDTVGFPVRALFDGVDDCLVVPSLDLSMTDKVTVVAGITKLRDAATGMVCEFTNDLNSYNGAFYLAAPRSSDYSEPVFSSKGNSAVLAGQTLNSFPAPRGMVLSATASISTDSAILSVNDSVYGTSASDQGTGNFSAGPFNIGARNGGASAPFNGAIQSLTVIGNLLPDGEVQILEASANAAMGKVY